MMMCLQNSHCIVHGIDAKHIKLNILVTIKAYKVLYNFFSHLISTKQTLNSITL